MAIHPSGVKTNKGVQLMKWKNSENQKNAILSENGCYKIVRYGKTFYAYFKPAGWKTFGQSCAVSFGASMEYKSLKDAKAATEKHLAIHGLNTQPFNRI